MMSSPPITTPSPVRLISAGIATTLVGVGLGRFAYAALLPGVIGGGWLSTSDASFVGAANLFGYLVGAVAANRTQRLVDASLLIKTSIALVALSFLVSAWQAPVWWFTLWRFVAGVTGAFLMVIVPALVSGGLPEQQRKRGSTWMFTGIGLGILLSATLVPTLINRSLVLSWVVLGVLSLAPLTLAWFRWPSPATPNGEEHGTNRSTAVLLFSVYAAYALDATGYVPHTVFWVDYLQHHRGFSPLAGGIQWAIFGMGAIGGPFFAGFMARRIGWHRALTLSLLLQGMGILLPMLVPGLATVTLSSLLVGAMLPSIVATTAGHIGELMGPGGQTRAWAHATAAFALSQAAGAYVMAALYSHHGTGKLIFEIGGSMLMLAVATMLPATCLSRSFSAPSNPDTRKDWS